MRSSITTPWQWIRLLAGLFAVFVVFHWSALALGSELGQAGLLVGALVVGLILGIECLAFGSTATAGLAT